MEGEHAMTELSKILIGIVVALATYITWDWLRRIGSESRAVTTVLLEEISVNINKLETKIDNLQNKWEKYGDEIFERLRKVEEKTALNTNNIIAFKNRECG